MSTVEFTAIYVGRGASGRPSEPAQDISLGGGTQGTADRSQLPPENDPGIARAHGAVYAMRGGVSIVAEGRPRWSAGETPGARDSLALRIIDLYEKHGESLFDITGGDFSIAVVDTRRREVLLGIDRMGIRSMYFAVASGGELIFGPTGAGIAKHRLIGSTLSRQALFDFMNFHMVPSPDTVFSGVQKLRPGHIAVIGRSGVRVRRYWRPVFATSALKPVEELAVELKERLKTAVGRCDPGEKTGAFLSGGLDSSSVAGMLGVVRGSAAKTFSIGFGEEGYDELAYARVAVEHFRAEPHEQVIGPREIVDAIPLLAKGFDEPFGNSSAVPTYYCARLARSAGVTQMLAGDGGDEIFAGNGHYARHDIFEWYGRLPRLVRERILEPAVLAAIPKDAVFPFGKVRSYVEQARIPLPLRLKFYDYMFQHKAGDIFDPDFLSGVDLNHPRSLMTRVYDEPDSREILDRLLYYDWQFVLADNDLRKVNRACEMGGVEVHYPMLDDDLVDFSLQIPGSMKLRRNELRYFFKNAMADFLPREIITKTKHGFGLPFGVWLKTSKDLQDAVYASLARLRSRRIIQPGFLESIIREHREGHPSIHGYVIWDLVMLENWLSAQSVSY
jgi:asparagine synthase (glutamine-hydrolysing)